MNYAVIWLAAAERGLVDEYLVARDHGQDELIAPAVVRIDRALRDHPETYGESRADNERVEYEAPLTVEFEVFPDERVVVITWVKYRRPGKR